MNRNKELIFAFASVLPKGVACFLVRYCFAF